MSRERGEDLLCEDVCGSRLGRRRGRFARGKAGDVWGVDVSYKMGVRWG